MRSLLPFAIIVPLASLLSSISASAQNPPVDLSRWTVEDLNGAGPWYIDPPRLFTSTTNTVNTDVSVLYSDFVSNVLEFRMSIHPDGGDDDLCGFVLGWNPGDSANATADYVVVDWKRATQTYQDWGTAPIGLALSHMQGTFTRGYGGAPIDLWSHTRNCTELARGNTHGSARWEFATDYHFRVIYLPGNPGSIDIWLNGVLEFHVTGAFSPGRFGCYNYSQSGTGFQFPLPGSFIPFGNGCPGTRGTPYLFGPEMPLVGSGIPIILANLPATGTPVLMLGLSNTTWQGVPLPLGLDPLGATGCALYTSSEVYLPIGNFNGTGYTRFDIPTDTLPGTRPLLYLQGLALDLGANQLGVVLSNAAAMTVGIR